MDILRNPVLVWFVVGLVMFLIEMATPGLVMLFFGIGAWVVAVLVLTAGISLNAQLGIFLAVSVLSLVFFRKALTKVFHGHKTGEQDPGKDLNEFEGKRAVVTERIVPGSVGKVEFKGSTWSAQADEDIPAGTAVVILSKDNLTLMVKRI